MITKEADNALAQWVMKSPHLMATDPYCAFYMSIRIRWHHTFAELPQNSILLFLEPRYSTSTKEQANMTLTAEKTPHAVSRCLELFESFEKEKETEGEVEMIPPFAFLDLLLDALEANSNTDLHRVLSYQGKDK